MYVQSLKVSGFTSFKDVTWKPERLNVLIGPNGSGKSNLLRALELIHAAAAGSLGDFVWRKGGFQRLLWGGLSQQMRFEIETAPDQPSAGGPLYRFTLTEVPESASFQVTSESLGFEHPPGPFRLFGQGLGRAHAMGERTAPQPIPREPASRS